MKRKNISVNLFLLLLIPILCGAALIVNKKEPKNSSVEFFVKEYRKDFHPETLFEELIFVSIHQQKLYFLKNGKVTLKFDVSTSKYGVGTKMYSQKTPVGLHRIKFKLGDGAPINGIIKAGVYAGEMAEVINEPRHINEDLITTRILWLEGEEDGVNKGEGVDSYYRNIYIHGTAEEGLIGSPASHGCVRMRNKEVLKLFNEVSKGAYVLILDH